MDALHEGSDRGRSLDYLDRAELAIESDDPAEALRALARARTLDPLNEEFPLLAAMLRMEDDPTEAARLALQALAIRPFHPVALNLLGLACLDCDRPDLAERVLERARRMAPALNDVERNLERARQAEREEGSDDRVRDWAGKLPVEYLETVLNRRGPTLSVCVLLRDGQEGEFGACLESLRGIADEVLLIDARSGGSEIRREEFPDVEVLSVDESRGAAFARNEGLRRADRDWILTLDADEKLNEGSADAVARAMREDGSLYHTVVVRENSGHHAQNVVRLVRNAPEIRFSGCCDERILPSLHSLEATLGLGGGTSEIRILRDRMPDPLVEVARHAEGIIDDPQVEEDREGDQHEIHSRTIRAWALLVTGRAEEALDLIHAVRGMLHDELSRTSALDLEEPTVLEGRCLLALERSGDAARLLGAYHHRNPCTASTLFLEGMALKSLGRVDDAAGRFSRALAIESEPTFACALPEVRGVALPNVLGAALIEQRKLDDARDAFELALSRDRENLEARLGLLGILLAEGQYEQTLQELDCLVESSGHDPRVWLAGAIVMGRLPRLSEVTLAWLKEALSRFPEHTELRRRLGEALLRSGVADEALATWDDLSAEEGSLAAARVAAALASGRELPPLPEELRETVGHEVLSWFQQWVTFQAYEALDRALVDITRAEAQLPGLAAITGEWLESIDQREAAAGVRSRLSGDVERV